MQTDSPFSKKVPNLQLAWDSTSYGDLLKCPRYYEMRMIHGWTSKERKIDLEFGIWLHSGRERYYHARARGAPHEAALDEALQFVLLGTWNPETDRPWQGDNYKNRLTLARTLIWYCDKWEHDPLTTLILANSKPAVEVSFRFGLGFGPTGSVFEGDADEPQEEFLLCGHIDRLVDFSGRTWGSDLKSTRSGLDKFYFNQFSPDAQMTIYTIAGKVVLANKMAGMIVDACQIGVNFSRFGRALIERTPEQLDEFMRTFRVRMREAEYYARSNYWPMNEKACFRCEFRGICSKSPSIREQWLKADFIKREWNPLKTRGDI